MNFFDTLQVIGIDILLSGDNAILIALAAKSVPAHQQKKVIFYGMIGAILFRILSATLIIDVLSYSYVQAIGGIILLRIAFHLIVQKNETHNSTLRKDATVFQAVKLIIISDIAMSIDNVIALTSVADGLLPIIFGILLSIPIILFGSQFLLALLERYPLIIYIGAGFLMHTAVKMIIEDKGTSFIFSQLPAYAHTLIGISVTFALLLIGIIKKKIKGITISI